MQWRGGGSRHWPGRCSSCSSSACSRPTAGRRTREPPPDAELPTMRPVWLLLPLLTGCALHVPPQLQAPPQSLVVTSGGPNLPYRPSSLLALVILAPASLATAPSVVCAALNPRRKSASENVTNRSVGRCQCGFAPWPVS